MPKMMTIVPAKTRPEKVSQTVYDEIKKGGPKTVPALTALEAVRNSKGAYQMKPEQQTVVAGSRVLEEMPNSELKQLAVQCGVKFHKKQVRRNELIALVRRKMEEVVDVVDDEEIEAGA